MAATRTEALPAPWQPVCRLDDLADGRARGFATDPRGDDGAFVVKRDGGLYAYRNLCPHNLRPLEYAKDRFLSADGSDIICYAHGAHFNIVDGVCSYGPCLGERLMTLPVRVHADWIWVALSPVPDQASQ
ncbi:Rieske (2Fe-2S) protein [Pseudoxanthomonas sp.]|uniref:Rieske (2Fe-2S) protein n=1 Tax=Pseudoxanthomonas sp. TaxID=1871049 RepID=UPI00261D167B|nr:Rieske (2Fe-2S) protein [Pseudoxanthomonas sp.]WDS35030.1 MAG: Rieske (2Fe-2S) protein [Pseudoxanthomonas sp.]